MLKNTTLFAKSAKEGRGGGSKNSGKSPLSQIRCISGCPLSLCHWQGDGYLQNFKAWFNHYCRLEATVDQELTLEDNFTSERLEL